MDGLVGVTGENFSGDCVPFFGIGIGDSSLFNQESDGLGCGTFTLYRDGALELVGEDCNAPKEFGSTEKPQSDATRSISDISDSVKTSDVLLSGYRSAYLVETK